MGSGLIDRIAETPANVTDQDGFKHICSRIGEMTFGDKSYCLKPARDEMSKQGAQSAAILQNNMKNKNKDLDRWRTSSKAPLMVSSLSSKKEHVNVDCLKFRCSYLWMLLFTTLSGL